MIPTVTGFIGERPRGFPGRCQLYVWCDWCVRWHCHGVACDERPGTFTHRAASCCDNTEQSAYKRHGYRIRISAHPCERVARSVREANSLQRSIICHDGRTTPGIERLREQRPTVVLRPHPRRSR